MFVDIILLLVVLLALSLGISMEWLLFKAKRTHDKRYGYKLIIWIDTYFESQCYFNEETQKWMYSYSIYSIE